MSSTRMIRMNMAALGLLAAAQATAQAADDGTAVPNEAAPMMAQPAVTPSATPLAPQSSKEPYDTQGFRSARFGMTDKEVLAAIGKDFGLKPEAVQKADNPIERTTFLIAPVKELDPGPGAATVFYILGYTTKKLIQVNVVWAAASKDANAAPYILAGTPLVNYFLSYGWKDGRTAQDVPIGPNTIAMFLAEDNKNGAVQVVLDGVAFNRDVNGKTQPSPSPQVPPSLRVSYVANSTDPDVFKLQKGKF